MKSLGHHILVEMYGCDPAVLNNIEVIETEMKNAAVEANATVVDSSFHMFSPYGVSGVVVIAESHLAIHTWPEYGYAAVDLFTCGDDVDPWVAYRYLEKIFKAQYASTVEMKRGQMDAVAKGKEMRKNEINALIGEVIQ